MGRRAARAFVGMGLAACALLAARATDSPAAAGPASDPRLVHGAVAAEGVPAPLTTAEGWTVGRPDVGTYLVVVEGGADLSVTAWDGAASVEVTPAGEGVSIVTFTSPDDRAVDAAFTFTAIRR